MKEGGGDAPAAGEGDSLRPGLTAAGEGGAVFKGPAHAARACVVVSFAEAIAARSEAARAKRFTPTSDLPSERD